MGGDRCVLGHDSAVGMGAIFRRGVVAAAKGTPLVSEGRHSVGVARQSSARSEGCGLSCAVSPMRRGQQSRGSCEISASNSLPVSSMEQSVGVSTSCGVASCAGQLIAEFKRLSCHFQVVEVHGLTHGAQHPDEITPLAIGSTGVFPPRELSEHDVLRRCDPTATLFAGASCSSGCPRAVSSASRPIRC